MKIRRRRKKKKLKPDQISRKCSTLLLLELASSIVKEKAHFRNPNREKPLFQRPIRVRNEKSWRISSTLEADTGNVGFGVRDFNDTSKISDFGRKIGKQKPRHRWPISSPSSSPSSTSTSLRICHNISSLHVTEKPQPTAGISPRVSRARSARPFFGSGSTDEIIHCQRGKDLTGRGFGGGDSIGEPRG